MECDPDVDTRDVELVSKSLLANGAHTPVEDDILAAQLLIGNQGNLQLAEQLIARAWEQRAHVSDSLDFMKEETAALGSRQHHEARILEVRGLYYQRLGHIERARTEFEQAFKLNPEGAGLARNFAEFEYENEDIDRAVEVLSSQRLSAVQTSGHNDALLASFWKEKGGSQTSLKRYLRTEEQRRVETRADDILASKISEPTPVPTFELAKYGGGSFSSSELRGKVSVLTFTDTSCSACREESSQLGDLRTRWAGKDVRFIVLTKSGLQAHPELLGTSQSKPIVLDATNYDTAAGVTKFPTHWFVDRNGNVVYKTGPEADIEFSFDLRIEDLLKDSLG